MSGAELGAGRCQQCGGPITGKGRRDRKYCSASCRTVAWSERTRKVSEQASSRASATKLDAVLVDRLADAVVLRLAAASTAPAITRPEPQPMVTTPAATATAESETIKQLQAEMVKMRAEFGLSRAQLRAVPDPRNAGAPLHLLEDGKLKLSIESPINQPRAAKRDAEGQSGENAAVPASQIEPLKAAHRKELAAKVEDHDQLAQKYSALFLAHNKLKTALENAAAEKQLLTKRIKDLERQFAQAKSEAETLQKTLEPLRAILSKEDPLLFLMRSKVNLQHRIAVGRLSIGGTNSGRHLPDDKPETRQAAAAYAAHAARQAFFTHRAEVRPGKTTWVLEGRRLDPISEEKLRKREEEAIEKLERELSLVTRIREETGR